MSLNDALSIAMSGLRANQAAMALVSSNVANAETPGYVRKTINQVTTNTGDVGTGIQVVGVNRELDDYIQAQLRTETSGASYATLRSSILQQLQSLYGNPDSTGTLENAYTGLTNAVQALSTSPDSQAARIGVINAANVVAQQLNATTNGIQTLRGAAEDGIKDSVASANGLLQQIATINNQLQVNPLGGTSTDSSTAALLDQRDQYVTQLSQLMDIRVTRERLQSGRDLYQLRCAACRRRCGYVEVQRAGHRHAQYAVRSQSREEQPRRPSLRNIPMAVRSI